MDAKESNKLMYKTVMRSKVYPELEKLEGKYIILELSKAHLQSIYTIFDFFSSITSATHMDTDNSSNTHEYINSIAPDGKQTETNKKSCVE